MPTYMVITAEISDAEKFRKYAVAAADLVAQFGGEYIVRAPRPLSLEGHWSKAEKMVISRWTSQRQALAFWNSADYAKVKKMRLGTANVHVTLFEGVDEK